MEDKIMYTVKIETKKKEWTYLFEAKNVQYQRIDVRELKSGTSHSVFGPDPKSIEGGDVLNVSYLDQNDEQKIFYLTEGRMFILQNGKTVDMAVVKWIN